jgi:hypothetical protein
VKRSLPFILLNIAISAATILIILVIWESTHRIAPEQTPVFIETPIPLLTTCQSSDVPEGDLVFNITNVIGSGDVLKEEVELKYLGISPFCMKGWQLLDEDGHRFDFPDYFQFYSNGAEVRIYSRAGTNTPLELFWGQTKSVWSSGEQVRLQDSHGKKQGQFTIP